MIRVLHIINGTKLGGISSVLLNYYKHVDRSQIQFDFVSLVPERGPMAEEFEKLGVHIYFMPTRSAGLRAFSKRLDALLREQRYDVVHSHACHSAWVDLRVAKKCGVPVRVAHAHNADKSRASLLGHLKRRISIPLVRHYATKRVACSRDAAVYVFGRHSLKERGLQILPNGIETARFAFSRDARAAARAELGIAPDTFVFGTVGCVVAIKNQIRLVHMLPEVLSRRPDSKMLLVGEGNCLPAIKAEAEALGVLDRVILTGGRSDIPYLLAAMDVFVMPSLQEGFGIAALEAAAAGLPVVLSDVIPRELSFIPRSAYLSLKSPVAAWAAQVCAFGSATDRLSGVDVVRQAGYDIDMVAKDLEDIYRGK